MSQQRRYVLHVEDDPDHLELVRRCFRALENGFGLEQVHDGEQALAYLNQRLEHGEALPHLVLLDLRMPKMGGLEVLQELKARELLKRLPVVILSTSNAPDDIRGAADAHANGYLVKPGDLKSLRTMLRRIDDYWLSSDQLGACPL